MRDMPVAKKAPRRTSRKPGRPVPGGTDLREHLLDQAVQLFARQGIAATPLSRIASEAGTTPAMLHYYFGDRARLLEAVVGERIAPLAGRLIQTVALTAPALDSTLIEGLVRQATAIVVANPWLPPLWVHEILSESGSLRELVLQRLASQLAPLLRDRIQAAQQSGRLNAGLDPRLTVVSLIGITLFPFASAPIWRRLFAADDITPEHIVRHNLALLARGLELNP